MVESEIRAWASIVAPPVISGRFGGPATEVAFCLNRRWQKSTNIEETNAARKRSSPCFIPQFGLSALFVFSTMTRLAFVTQRMFSLFETAVMSLKEDRKSVV